MSAAKCETGWGDLSTRALFNAERPSPHPAANFIRGDPPPPGEGGSGPFRSNLTSSCSSRSFRRTSRDAAVSGIAGQL